MFPSSPGYATDAQLSQMARGGLPNAVNEEITRLALRRGARAVPQPQTPRAPMPMSGEEMIKDFVNRVRQENTNAANSIVPAGTPMQQPQQPPQPAQASGIAGYSSGGVRGFQDAGAFISSEDKVPRLTRDQKFGWHPDQEPLSAALDGVRNPNGGPSLPESKYYPPSGMNPKLGMPRTLNPQKPPRDPDYQKLVDLSQGRIGNIYDGWSEIEGHHGRPDPSAIQPSADAGIAALMADAPRLGAFKPSKFIRLPEYEDAKLIDLNEAGDESVKKNLDEINAVAAPYNEGAAELEGMSEEIKRKEIFNGMVQAGIAMMQGGGASFDPRSGDMMAIMGDGASAYVESLTKDRKRQQELKEKIVAYKGAASELTFNAKNQMFTRGADIAQARNQQAITENAYKHQYKGRSAEMENTFNLGVDELRMRELGLNLQADIAKFEAGLKVKLSQQSGLDPETAEKIAYNAGKAYNDAYSALLSALDLSQVSDRAKREELIADAQAQGVGAAAAYLDRINSSLFGGALGDIESITRTEQGRYRGAASVEVDREGVRSLERPYSPKIDGEAMSVQSYLGRFSNGS